MPAMRCSRAPSPVTRTTGIRSSLWRLFNPAADFEAADARQVHVEQNEVRLLPLDHRDRALTAARRFDVVALDGQQANDQPQVGVVVFDDKNRGVGVFQRAGISGSKVSASGLSAKLVQHVTGPFARLECSRVTQSPGFRAFVSAAMR